MKSVKRHYHHQIKYFDKEFSGMAEYTLATWQKSYIQRIRKYLLDGDLKKRTLIDIASGSGYVAIEMARLGMKVIATDLSPQSIKNLQKFKKDFKLQNLTIIKCQAEKLPLKDKSVDYVVANAILEHIPDEEEAIKEWKRILKPGGKLFITVPLKFRYLWPFLWLPNFIHDKRIGHLRRYDKDDLRKKFNLQLKKYFYSGHFVKVIGVMLNIFLRTNKYDDLIEKKDQELHTRRYGASNISVVLLTSK